MASVEKTIDVDVPIETAYNQWTQFESFPNFMEGVESVRQLDEKRLHWKADVGGQVEEWDAVITEQIPDTRIAWRNIDGIENAGVVTFHRLDDSRCRIALQMEYEPRGAVESIGDALGFASRQVEGDLERFKRFIEERGNASGAWRGEIERPESGVGVGAGSATATPTTSVLEEEEPPLLT